MKRPAKIARGTADGAKVRMGVEGRGKDAFLWISEPEKFVVIARNNASTRRFLHRALARFEQQG